MRCNIVYMADKKIKNHAKLNEIMETQENLINKIVRLLSACLNLSTIFNNFFVFILEKKKPSEMHLNFVYALIITVYCIHCAWQ